MKYKILIHGVAGGHGGIETFLMNNFRAFDKDKFQMDFLCHAPIPFEKEISSKGGRVFYIPSKTHHPIKYKRALKKFLKEHTYNCIWDNESSIANIDYLKYAKKYGIPRRIIHSHTTKNVYTGIKRILVDIFQNKNKKILSHYATDLWACSYDAANWMFPKEDQNKVLIIKNGIDVSKMKFNIKERNNIRERLNIANNYVIGTVGRLSSEKNQTFLIDIMNVLVGKKGRKNFTLILVGDGPLKNQLNEKVKKYGLEESVKLVGLQTNTEAWYSSFDCFILPSWFEGLSVAGLEAQANGLPLLISDGARPNDLKVIPNLFHLSLSESAEKWANKIIMMSEQINRVPYNQVKVDFHKQKLDIGTISSQISAALLKNN